MNYRHHFHAGNHADVIKHALLVQLFRDLQKKPKGFLFLDTHAGRGRYDLERAAAGDSLLRAPEWPDGIGRLWSLTDAAMPAALQDYLGLVREFDRRSGNLGSDPRFYPGSPWLARLLARPVDRLALYEKHPADCTVLQHEFRDAARVAVHLQDGYVGVRASLPPPERRAFVLIDPPFEAQDEFEQVTFALGTGLKRFPGGVFAAWYPLTLRARATEFFDAVCALRPPSALSIEMTVAGEKSALKMRGCGLMVINAPWRFDQAATSLVGYLAPVLAQEPGGAGRVEWLVPER